MSVKTCCIYTDFNVGHASIRTQCISCNVWMQTQRYLTAVSVNLLSWVTYLRQKCHLASSVSYSAAIQHAVAQNQHQTSISFPSCVNLWDFIAPTQYIPRGNSSIKGEKAHYWEAGESKKLSVRTALHHKHSTHHNPQICILGPAKRPAHFSNDILLSFTYVPSFIQTCSGLDLFRFGRVINEKSFRGLQKWNIGFLSLQ